MNQDKNNNKTRTRTKNEERRTKNKNNSNSNSNNNNNNNKQQQQQQQQQQQHQQHQQQQQQATAATTTTSTTSTTSTTTTTTSTCNLQFSSRPGSRHLTHRPLGTLVSWTRTDSKDSFKMRRLGGRFFWHLREGKCLLCLGKGRNKLHASSYDVGLLYVVNLKRK